MCKSRRIISAQIAGSDITRQNMKSLDSGSFSHAGKPAHRSCPLLSYPLFPRPSFAFRTIPPSFTGYIRRERAFCASFTVVFRGNGCRRAGLPLRRQLYAAPFPGAYKRPQRDAWQRRCQIRIQAPVSITRKERNVNAGKAESVHVPFLFYGEGFQNRSGHRRVREALPALYRKISTSSCAVSTRRNIASG